MLEVATAVCFTSASAALQVSLRPLSLHSMLLISECCQHTSLSRLFVCLFAVYCTDSVVSGTDSVVSGTDSIVSGTDSVVSGTDSIVSGTDSVVSDTDSVVSDTDNVVSGTDSVVSCSHGLL